MKTPILTLHNHATTWSRLADFVNDSAADALHHPAALAGASPQLRLLISRRQLPEPAGPLEPRQLQRLSHQLRTLGIAHSIHRVVPGDEEPANHHLRVTFF